MTIQIDNKFLQEMLTRIRTPPEYPYDDLLLPPVSYRRTGQFIQERQKEIKCPYCDRLLAVVAATMKVALYREPKRKDVTCQVYRKCHSCHGVVGMVFDAA
jgi:hypothetical protein